MIKSKSISIKVTDVFHKKIKEFASDRCISMQEFALNALNREIWRIEKNKKKYRDANVPESLIGIAIKHDDDLSDISGINGDLL